MWVHPFPRTIECTPHSDIIPWHGTVLRSHGNSAKDEKCARAIPQNRAGRGAPVSILRGAAAPRTAFVFCASHWPVQHRKKQQRSVRVERAQRTFARAFVGLCFGARTFARAFVGLCFGARTFAFVRSHFCACALAPARLLTIAQLRRPDRRSGVEWSGEIGPGVTNTSPVLSFHPSLDG